MPDNPMPKKVRPERGRSVTKAPYYLIATALLVAAPFWGRWMDEGNAVPSSTTYQEEFAKRFRAYLSKAELRSPDAERKVKQDPQYQKLYATYKQLEEQEQRESKEIEAKLADVKKHLAQMDSVFLDASARVTARMHEAERVGIESSGGKSILAEMAEYKAKKQFRDPYDPSAPEMNYGELDAKYNDLKKKEGELTLQLAGVMKPSKDALMVANSFVSGLIVDLTKDQLEDLRRRYADGYPKRNENRAPAANSAGACEACHLGVTQTGLQLTPVVMSLPGQEPDKYARGFVTHPKPELLQIHDPAKFGCSACHGGNGHATTISAKAQDDYQRWHGGLYPKGYMEAGCQTCHAADMVLAHGTELATTLDLGKDLYRQGCMGCHRYPGFNPEPEELNSIAEKIRTLEQQKKNNLQQADLKSSQARTKRDARRLKREAENLKLANSQIDSQLEQLDLRMRDLVNEEKKVAHNFKEMRHKLNPNWIPVFVKGTGRATGPTASNEGQIRAMAAYLWQSALQDPIEKQEHGDPVRGKELLETRGCMACHPLGTPPQLIGGRFAIPLTLAGERDKYDYLVRWIYNPRQRIRPYCLVEKKDIGPEDYAKHGLPYVFDLDHDRCPNDGHVLQVQQQTTMPNLRLSMEESRDIASYLLTLKKRDPNSFPDAYLDDRQLNAEGKFWVGHYGCSACHEVPGFETQGPIGSDLTYEGDKPVDQFDFGQFKHMAQLGTGEPITFPEDLVRLPEGPAKAPWYTPQGFFEHKLAEPNVYDTGLVKSDVEKLRMPNQRLTPDQLRALTTVLLGSRKSELPESYSYQPDDARADIQRGWWVIRKYNCMGCHQLLPGQQTTLMTMPYYRDHPEQLAPPLMTEGERVTSEWLAKYLKDPALSDTDTHRNSIRPYLKVRMPTFNFSKNELGILVRFFEALSHQPTAYSPEPLAALTPKETEMAQSLLSSPAVPCLSCHATGDPAHDKFATAPNFLLAQARLKPSWVERFIVDPQAMSPGTVMPSGLFRRENGHWVINAPFPASLKAYDQDQVKLLVRYIFQLTPERQRRLVSGLARRSSASASN